jgi:protein TonB
MAVEEMPQLVGGMTALMKSLEYPELAIRAGIQGRVYIVAFVNEQGDVVRAEILKGIGGGCDEAALAAVKKAKFIPGKQRGKPVKTRISIPVEFKLSH